MSDNTRLLRGNQTQEFDKKFDIPILAEVLAKRAILMGPDRLFMEAFPETMRTRRPNVASVILQVSLTAAARPSTGPYFNIMAVRSSVCSVHHGDRVTLYRHSSQYTRW